MTVKELTVVLNLTVFHLPDPDREMTGGYAGDLLSWVMGRAEEGNVWVTIMSNQNVAAVAVMSDAACVLLTEGVAPDEALLDRARQQGVNLLGTERSTFQTVIEIGKLASTEL